MQVLKFGGTSMAGAENIKKVISILDNTPQHEKMLVVVSAMSGITDLLLTAATLAAAGDEKYKEKTQLITQRHLDTVRDLLPITAQSQMLSFVKKSGNEIEDICDGIFLLRELTPRTKDRMMAYGELLSSHIIVSAMQAMGKNTQWKDTRELIKTNDNFNAAQVDFAVTNSAIQNWYKEAGAHTFILPGFIASDEEGNVTTLGRGGSDYTAAILAAALHADRLEIWTDVSGMMTADPRWVTNARVISRISYQEAMELSHFGAKVIYPPTIQPVMGKNIPVWIKNTFSPQDEGTLIESLPTNHENIVIGISSIGHISLISLEGSGMIGVPGFSKRLFEVLSQQKINVIMITQSSSEHSICVGIEEANAERARLAINHAFANEIALEKVEPLKVETNLSIVALVGDNMKSHPGISGRMFSALGKNGVNIRAIAQGSSEKNISAVISSKDVRKAINVLHEEFFETTYRQINLFVVGTGNVGSKFLEQLRQQMNYLQQERRLQLRLAGLANSRKMLLQDEGISLADCQTQLQQAEQADISNFINEIISRNLRNSIFVDITASEEVAAKYGQLLCKSVSVVACNKVAPSSAYSNYKKLKELAREYSCQFLFETNVGAGLPVIATLNDLVHSGDRVHTIQAVLSGTLNFVFNHYDGSRKFADVVRQAQEEGYTEPDPRLDLSGTDVMRKILILAREAGAKIEMEEIVNNSFMPASCMQGTVDDFYKEMEKHEPYFRQMLEKANAAGCKLKFVATYEKGKASVGLQQIDPAHNLYHLYGKDNIVLFYTDRYKDQPLVIKGAGAGADVTASGVFADVMRAAGW